MRLSDRARVALREWLAECPEVRAELRRESKARRMRRWRERAACLSTRGYVPRVTLFSDLPLSVLLGIEGGRYA